VITLQRCNTLILAFNSVRRASKKAGILCVSFSARRSLETSGEIHRASSIFHDSSSHICAGLIIARYAPRHVESAFYMLRICRAYRENHGALSSSGFLADDPHSELAYS